MAGNRNMDSSWTPERVVWVQALVQCSWAMLNSHSASLNPGAQMGAGEFTAGGNPAMD